MSQESNNHENECGTLDVCNIGQLRICSYCSSGSKDMISCSKCKSVAYCNADCSRRHKPFHKFNCQLGRPIDAADFLVLACQEYKFPDDQDTLSAFGFNYFPSATDRIRLFKIYCHLVRVHDVSDDELREALKVDRIKECVLRRLSRSWLAVDHEASEWLNQQQGFKAYAVGQTLAEIIQDTARSILDPEEQDTPLEQLRPRAKLRACVFYSQIRNGYVLDAAEDNWLLLGFCTAPNERAVSLLVAVYADLIQLCTFEEFWRSMESSTMAELFAKYGLGQVIDGFRNFKKLLGATGGWYPSVWELKRFTSTKAARHPEDSVTVDYGFMHCINSSERESLRGLYRSYFSRGEDEMLLHEACIQGRLAVFLDLVFSNLGVPRDVLSNDYPLEDCDYMGMTAESVACQPASFESSNIGPYTVIASIPDEQVDSVADLLQEMAGFLHAGLRRRISKHEGKVIHRYSL